VKPAPLKLRVLAALIDISVVFAAWYFIISAWGETNPGGSFATATVQNDKALTGMPAVLLFVGTGAFWILPEWLVGASLGKWLCRLCVVSEQEQQISLQQSLKRNLLRLVDFFPFYLPGFLASWLTPKRQRLGDLWAKTLVIRRRDFPRATSA